MLVVTADAAGKDGHVELSLERLRRRGARIRGGRDGFFPRNGTVAVTLALPGAFEATSAGDQDGGHETDQRQQNSGARVSKADHGGSGCLL
jgi:hypothetical protein